MKAQISQVEIPIKEIARMVMREQGITEGHWEIGLQCDFHGVNVAADQGEAFPALILKFTKFSLIRVQQPTAASIDASAQDASEQLEIPDHIEV